MGTDFLRLTYEGGRDVPQVFICESQPVGIFSFLVPFLLMFDCMTDLLSWGVMRAQVFQMCFVPQHDKATETDDDDGHAQIWVVVFGLRVLQPLQDCYSFSFTLNSLVFRKQFLLF